MSIKVENIQVSDFKAAIRGMRNPKNSHYLSDSLFGLTSLDYSQQLDQAVKTWMPEGLPEITPEYEKQYLEKEKWYLNNCIMNKENNMIEYALLGFKDIELAQTLLKGNTDDHKFMRQIHVSFDITAPIFWWQEFDTYKVGTVRNSCSKMHKIHASEITINSFTHDGCSEVPEALEALKKIVTVCESLRIKFNETNDKKYWRALIEILPESYNMKATISLNYQVLRSMYLARKTHKLIEWRTFCEILKTLPYAEELICFQTKKTADAELVEFLHTNHITLEDLQKLEKEKTWKNLKKKPN